MVMTAPDRSIEDAALIAFVRERIESTKNVVQSAITRDIADLFAEHVRMYQALLSRLEGLQTTKDDEKAATRQSSPCPTCGTGSPRTQPKGVER